ncbi:hypothetical protein ACFXJO_03490 [Streptomyces lavendulae]|uniref:hypothetical protein n=1 Tax=Streptomyces lavendulae TaxID=1914 RepID=UPI0036A66868
MLDILLSVLAFIPVLVSLVTLSPGFSDRVQDIALYAVGVSIAVRGIVHLATGSQSRGWFTITVAVLLLAFMYTVQRIAARLDKKQPQQ